MKPLVNFANLIYDMANGDSFWNLLFGISVAMLAMFVAALLIVKVLESLFMVIASYPQILFAALPVLAVLIIYKAYQTRYRD